MIHFAPKAYNLFKIHNNDYTNGINFLFLFYFSWFELV
jgi:hypothetical protein